MYGVTDGCATRSVPWIRMWCLSLRLWTITYGPSRIGMHLPICRLWNMEPCSYWTNDSEVAGSCRGSMWPCSGHWGSLAESTGWCRIPTGSVRICGHLWWIPTDESFPTCGITIISTGRNAWKKSMERCTGIISAYKPLIGLCLIPTKIFRGYWKTLFCGMCRTSISAGM